MFNKITAFTLIVLSTLPSLSHADIHLVNNTNLPGTAYIGISPCSSSIGEGGIAKPHSSITVPQSVINMFCGLTACEAHVFLTRDCGASGKEVAIATIEASKGVTSINNLDKAHYQIAHQGSSITITPVGNNTSSWFKRLFG